VAKLKAPLFSFGASGQLAKALVYFPWKGIPVVRQYVVPANPQSDDQVVQRGHMTAAVAEFHAAKYTDADMVAWSRLAGIGAKTMTGFNRMVQAYVKERMLCNTWERLFNAHNFGVSDTTLTVDVEKAAGGNAPTLHYGTRKTHFPNTEVMGNVGGDIWRADLINLTAKTLYYCYVDVGTSAADYARTGIYSQRTDPA